MKVRRAAAEVPFTVEHFRLWSGRFKLKDGGLLTLTGAKVIADKIWLAPNGVLLGCASNNWAVKQHLEAGLAARLSTLPPGLNRADAKLRIETAVQERLSQTVYGGSHLPTFVIPDHLSTVLLASGQDDAGYWLMFIDHNGLATDESPRGFKAIGSGFGAAELVALMLDNYEPRTRPTDHLKLMAHRMISGCIDHLAQFVGGPIQLWMSQDGDPFTKASVAELTELEEAVKDWLAVEQASLGASLGEAPDTGAPMPEDLGE